MSNKLQKNFFGAILCFVLIAAIAVCFAVYILRSNEDNSVEYIGIDQHAEGATMGTFYSIRVHNFPKNKDWNIFTAEVQKQLDQIEQKMSLFNPNSEVSKFNDSKSLDWFSVSSETFEVVSLAAEISAFSGGAFDITATPLVNIWGFGNDRKRRSIDEIIREVAKLKTSVGYEKLTMKLNPPAIKKAVPELKINLAAIAKGYAVDVISRFCDDSGLTDYMIEIGGEVCCKGDKGKGNDWRVGIETPVIIPRGEWGEVYQIINIKNQCMATSGGNRNFHIIDGKSAEAVLKSEKLNTQAQQHGAVVQGRSLPPIPAPVYYSHLIDPRTGLPCQSGNEEDFATGEQLASVSVLDKSCARADALATAFFVLGANEGLKIANKHNVPVLFLIRKDKKIREITSDSFYKFAAKNTKN
ncbi:MAG: FAD:protein FMN transferase [Planctomycetaceae bacterium]|nr:FAD:protein FMN transferase [Planctomycetaceae bacterium]